MWCAGFEEREGSGQEGRGVGGPRAGPWPESRGRLSGLAGALGLPDERAQGCVDFAHPAERHWTEGSLREASAFNARVWSGAPLHERPHPMLRPV